MDKSKPIKVIINIKSPKHRLLPDKNYFRKDVDLGEVKRMVTFVFQEDFKYDSDINADMYFLFDPVPSVIPEEFTILNGSRVVGVSKIRHN